MDDYNFGTSMFMGETTRGIEMPFFFDPHTPIFNNIPPGVLITGGPGSGKSFLAMTLCTISAVLGKTTVVLDLKGDFLSLMNLEDQIGKFNLWNLADKRRKGILDPFRMSDDDGEKLDLAISLIDIFLGGISPEQRTALAPIVKDVIQEPNPSLSRVVEMLRGSTRPAARDLGTTLDLISRLPFASLCFAPAGKPLDTVSINKGLTVVTLIGMDMPKEGGVDNKSRLSTGILFLLTDFVRRVMKNDTSNTPKTLVIDEAWALLSVPAGAAVVKEVALLGRSRNIALILATQNNSHLKHLDIENTISTRFAFKSSTKEAEDIVRDMQLPEGERFDEIITSLQNGECLVRDSMGRFATVQISAWREDWKQAFKTNPLDKIRAQAAKAAEGQALSPRG